MYIQKKMLKKKVVVAKSFRLFYFDITNDSIEEGEEDEGGKRKRTDNKQFMVQMYGINERGETCSITVEDFEPFFYVKVGDDWTSGKMHALLSEIKSSIGDYYKFRFLAGRESIQFLAVHEFEIDNRVFVKLCGKPHLFLQPILCCLNYLLPHVRVAATGICP